MQLRSFMTSMLVVAAASGCGKVKSAVHTMDGDSAQNGANFTAANLNGFWQANGGGEYQLINKNRYWVGATMQLQAGHLTRTLTYATNADAAPPVFTAQQVGTYRVGDSIDDRHRSLYLLSLTTTATATSDALVDDLDAAASCGLMQWPLNTSTDLSATTCNTLAVTAGLNINAVQGFSDNGELRLDDCDGKTCREDAFSYVAARP